MSVRVTYAGLAVGTIGVGLLVHECGEVLGPVVQDMLGDALWAAMIGWWIGTAWPKVRAAVRMAAAFGVCVAVELSQLYHTPALDALRQTRVGHLVLGSGFDPRDFVAYALGVAGAFLLDVALSRRGR